MAAQHRNGAAASSGPCDHVAVSRGSFRTLEAFMTKAEFENYCFLRLYASDLNTAIHAIATLKRYRKADVQVALLRDIAVTYARPFSINRGNEHRKHNLDPKHVPSHAMALHEHLLKLRNSQFAHTDLTFHNPKVAKFGTKENPWYPMSLKSFDYRGLLRRVPEIRALIKAVEENLKTEIRRYEQRF